MHSYWTPDLNILPEQIIVIKLLCVLSTNYQFSLFHCSVKYLLYLLAELSMANMPGAVTFIHQLMAHMLLLWSHFRAVALADWFPHTLWTIHILWGKCFSSSHIIWSLLSSWSGKKNPYNNNIMCFNFVYDLGCICFPILTPCNYSYQPNNWGNGQKANKQTNKKHHH